MSSPHVPQRFPEIDLARGTAVVMMVVFHIGFDLYFLGVTTVPATSAPWRLLALATAGLFLFVVGVSLSISAARARRHLSREEFVLKYLRRGAGIFLLGIAITLVTWILLPGLFIRFGILHLIGLAVVMSPLYTRLSWKNLLLGSAIVALGPVVAGIRGSDWLLWLGFHSPEFYSIDYTPVFPWLGVVLIGVFSGDLLYPGGRQRWQPAVPPSVRDTFGFLGRHSLAIYLVHQPIILGGIFLLSPGAFAGVVFPPG